MLVVDEVFHVVQSETSNNEYEVRLRADMDNHWWLSCQCKSWTTGKHNKGKEVYERRCKHTDATIIERAEALHDRGVQLHRGTGTIAPKSNYLGVQTEVEINAGFNRRVLR